MLSGRGTIQAPESFGSQLIWTAATSKMSPASNRSDSGDWMIVQLQLCGSGVGHPESGNKSTYRSHSLSLSLRRVFGLEQRAFDNRISRRFCRGEIVVGYSPTRVSGNGLW